MGGWCFKRRAVLEELRRGTWLQRSTELPQPEVSGTGQDLLMKPGQEKSPVEFLQKE
jgi:hypothetical protein